MYIGRIMHTDLITVKPKTTLVEATKLIEEKKIDHLLVVDDDNKLVGVVSDRDLKQYWASPATTLSVHELNYLLEKVEVAMIMVKAVITVPANTTIERAALIMQQHRISSLPVTEDDELVGIITSTDVMDVLLKAIGMSEDSVRLEVFVKDRIGKLAEVCDCLRDAGINILSLISWPEAEHQDIVQLVIRVARADKEVAISALATIRLKAKHSYSKDITPYLPTE